MPLVDRSDFERAAGWFTRHGRAAVFFGRLIPGVRSLISLPAGAARMPVLTFSVFTIAGSAIWNTLLIGLGAALGTQYALIDRYANYLNYAVYAALGVLLVVLITRGIGRARARRTAEGSRVRD
jgi:membrane protein DedA with SNARE-associated domain